MMWYEFPISTDLRRQREIIRQLRKWIVSLESRGIIEGFAFDHYFPNPEALHIRFDCTDNEKLQTVKNELEIEVKKLLPNYVLPAEDRLWDGGQNSDQVYKAYELGSRCAFLVWDLIDSGRFPEGYFSDFFIEESRDRFVAKRSSFEFQYHFTHGIMNCLGIHKYPNEALVHSNLLIAILRNVNRSEDRNEWIEKGLTLE
jgi:hypothetical protein